MVAETQHYREYLGMMAAGAFPPHNWSERVTKDEKAKIFDAFVDYCVSCVKEGKPHPRIPGRGLSKEQKKRIYDARGFASDEIERRVKREEKAKEKKDWLDSHGGPLTQAVMTVAYHARCLRESYIRNKRRDKSLRKAIRLGFVKHLRYSPWQDKELAEFYHWGYLIEREQMKAMREQIVIEARYEHKLTMAAWAIERRYGSNHFILKQARKVGFAHCGEYKLGSLPKLFCKTWMGKLVGNDLGACLLYCGEVAMFWEREERSKTIKKYGDQSSAESARQLRALGFIA